MYAKFRGPNLTRGSQGARQIFKFFSDSADIFRRMWEKEL